MSTSRASAPARVIDTTGEDITERAEPSRREVEQPQQQEHQHVIPFASMLRRVPIATFWPDPRGDARA